MVGSKGFKELPDSDRQEIMWRVAVSSAIETTEPAYKIFARLLHNYLTDDVWPGLCEDWEAETRETYNKTVLPLPSSTKLGSFPGN